MAKKPTVKKSSSVHQRTLSRPLMRASLLLLQLLSKQKNQSMLVDLSLLNSMMKTASPHIFMKQIFQGTKVGVGV
jgi:hypothetical protein